MEPLVWIIRILTVCSSTNRCCIPGIAGTRVALPILQEGTGDHQSVSMAGCNSCFMYVSLRMLPVEKSSLTWEEVGKSGVCCCRNGR
jgi:hypothetical protein